MGNLLLLGEVAPALTSTDFKPIIDAITSQLSVVTVVGVLAAAAAICVTFVFIYWGIRKVSGMIMKAFKKGKLAM